MREMHNLLALESNAVPLHGDVNAANGQGARDT